MPIQFCAVVQYGPILESLGSYLDIRAIRNLQLTCHQYAGLYNYLLPTRWNVDTTLSRFLHRPKDLRSLLRECNAVVSGSLALQFFEGPTDWQPSDMDVYLNLNQMTTMHKHLITVQDCNYYGTKTAEEVDYPTLHIREVRTYGRRDDVMANSKIQLIVFERNINPLSAIIEGFHSTTVVNLLTATEAISVFPLTTFIRRKNYMLQYHFEQYYGLVSKYLARGYILAEVLPRERKKLSNIPIRKARSLTDRRSWRIVYGADGISRHPGSTHAAIGDEGWFTMRECPKKLWINGPNEDRALPYSTSSLSHYYLTKWHAGRDDRRLRESIASLPAAHPLHYDVSSVQRLEFCDCPYGLYGGCHDGSYVPGSDYSRYWELVGEAEREGEEEVPSYALTHLAIK